MKASPGFVVVFLLTFLVSIVGTISALILDFYSSWMGWLVLGFVIVLLWLFGRKFIKGAKRDVKVASRFVKKEEKEYPTLFKVLHFLILLVPVFILSYLIYVNFITFQEFNYFYDIGSEQDVSKPYLSPLNRISEADVNSSYRNLTSQLVYFNVLIPRGSDSVHVLVRVKDGFPESGSMYIGGQNKVEWSYLSKIVYSPVLNLLSKYNHTSGEYNIYRINPKLPIVSNISDLPSGSVVAENVGLKKVPVDEKYNLKNLTINVGLRDAHTFYLYLNDSLVLDIKKQDINWYNGSDELNVSLFDLNDALLGSITIADDGLNDRKITAPVQSGRLIVENLSSGVYVLKFSGYDGIIREMKLNTNKIVTNKLFLADSNVYLNGSQKNSTLYIGSNRESGLKFVTYHSQGVQNVSVDGNIFSVSNYSSDFIYNLGIGEQNISVPHNDLIVSSNSFISFSKESFFEPFKFVIVGIPSDVEDLKYVDYIVSDYILPEQKDGWIVGEASFDVKDLYIKDGKLSMLINTPHFAREDFQNSTIAVDWVNISVKKNGF